MNGYPSRKNIIDAAIETLEKEGFHKFTIEKVAKFIHTDTKKILSVFPNTNSLISAALSQTLFTGLVENLDECIAKYKNNNDLLKHLFIATLSGSLNYPKIIKSHFYSAFILETKHSISIRKLQQFIEKTWRVIEPNIEMSKRELTRRKLNQAFASVFFVGLFPTIFKPLGYNLWADDLVHSVMGE